MCAYIYVWQCGVLELVLHYCYLVFTVCHAATLLAERCRKPVEDLHV